ncbi:hypothetical protein [Candidatus Soleaferrea massiliensis]|uniref:hypothetical protein n=1 Tax=Candidatus Soleaferrea massiliensis TaxID=1470354 RepID=UPI0005907D8A|nr:hypothetical protein [Candidatus Soleaferrea massiliensis]
MANSNNYSYDDMMRMQQDAIRRVKEMQRASSQNMRGDAGAQNTRGSSQQNRQRQNTDNDHQHSPHANGTNQQNRQHQNTGNSRQQNAGDTQHRSGNGNHPDERQGPGGWQQNPQHQDGQNRHPHAPQEDETQKRPPHEEEACDENNTENDEPEFEPSTFLKGVLDRFGLDSEKAMLLVMILILLNDGADKKMILALLYLLI